MGDSDRVRFSINLREDFDIYGIDETENLDDWSFLDTKPEPIPEKTEEEKQLFEKLLKPAISEEELEEQIHGRLQKLIMETDEVLNNGVKVELTEPLDINPCEVEPLIDKNSFAFQQAEQMSTIVKTIRETTEKEDDIQDFINSVTKSDKITFPEIQAEPQIIPEPQSTNQSNLDQTVPEPIDNSNQRSTDETQVPISPRSSKPIDSQPIVPSKKSMLSRYKRDKTPTIASVLREIDETDRLQSKFKIERKKREEEAAAEAEKLKKEMEERQNQFFASLEMEVQMHKEEMKKKPKYVPHSKEVMEKMQAALQKKLSSIHKPVSQPLIIELQTNNPSELVPKSHLSKTFQTNVLNKAKEKLQALLQKKKEKHSKEISAIYRIAIFLRFSRFLKLAKNGESIKNCHATYIQKKAYNQIKNRYLLRKKQKEEETRKRKDEEEREKENEIINLQKHADLFQRCRRICAAVKIQSIWRNYQVLYEAKQAEEAARNIQEKAKSTLDPLTFVRQAIDEQFPNARKNIPARRKPEIPEIAPAPDLDMSWIDQIENENLEDELNDLDFLNSLPDHFNSSKTQTKIHKAQTPKKITTESKSEPIPEEADAFLEQFGKKTELPPDLELPQFAKKYKDQNSSNTQPTSSQQNSPVKEEQNSKELSNTNKEGDNEVQMSPDVMMRMKKIQDKRKQASNAKKQISDPMERFHNNYDKSPKKQTKTKEQEVDVIRFHEKPGMKRIMGGENEKAKRLRTLKKVLFGHHEDE